MKSLSVVSIFFLCFLQIQFGFAQNVGINVSGLSPNTAAILDIDAAPNFNKGLLIPRVTFSQRTTGFNPLSVAAQGLTVYQTDAGGFGEGFYFNTSTSTTPAWSFLLNNTSGWSLTGNALTTPSNSVIGTAIPAGQNYVGTSDLKDFVLATNNLERLRISSAGNIGIGTSTPGTLLDVNGSTRALLYTFPAPTGDPAPVITARTVPSGQGASAEKTELILFHSNDPANAAGADQITLRAPALSFQTFNDVNVLDMNNNTGYNERMYINSIGNVGIGTTAPGSKLTISRLLEAAAYQAEFRVEGGITDGNFDGIRFTQGAAGATPLAGIRVLYHNSGSPDMGFYLRDGGATEGQKMVILNNGNAGIGTTNPLQKLQVAGDINIETGSGVRINNTATSGEYLRGNGTRFVSSAIQSADIPSGSTNYIQNQTAADQAAGFRINGNGLFNGGQITMGTATPLANTLLTMNLSGGSGTGINVTSGSSSYNNITSTNSGSATASYYAVGGRLTSGVALASGYLGYHTGTANLAANYFAGYFQGKTAITSSSSPDGIADLEVQNTTSGAGNPATVFLRQTTSLTTTANVLNNLNFGDNHSTSPQAQIQVIRGAAGGASDLPTDMAFSTTPDASATLTERMRIMNNGNVGIGTTAPGVKLDVGGDMRAYNSANSFLYLSASGANSRANLSLSSNTGASVNREWRIVNEFGANLTFLDVTASQVRMVINTSGNVGIGTTAPAYKLDVAGDINLTGALRIGAAAGTVGQVLTSAAGGANTWTTPASGTITAITGTAPIVSSGGNTPAISITQSGTAANGFLSSTDWNTFNNKPGGTGTTNYLARWTSSTALGIGATFDNGTNVGIGTTTPQKKLDIKTTSTSGVTFLQTLGGGTHLSAAAVGIGFDPEGYGNRNKQAIVVEGDGSGWGHGNLRFLARTSNDGTEATLSDAVMSIIWNTGNVGIGTTSPVSKFHLSNGAPSGLGGLPANTLASFDNGSANNYLTFRNTADNGTYSGIQFQDNNVGGYIAFRNYVGSGANDGNNGDYMVYGSYTDHIFQNGGSEAVNGKTETMRIKQNGNVGIGTTSPSTQLHSTGGVRFQTLTGTGNRFVITDLNGNLAAGSATTGGIITGSGTLDYVPKWTPNGTTLGNSSIFDNGNVGIGTAIPSYKLDVSGNASMNAEYPTLNLDHPNSGGLSGITFRSRVNFGSDIGFLIMQDESTNTPGTGSEDVRLTLGVYNDFRQSTAHSDELWLQGGGRLVQNVGSWDAELNAIVGVPGVGTTGGYEWRVNNVSQMAMTHGGNVGIGTTNPGTKLHVNSAVRISPFTGGEAGSTYLTGADARLVIADGDNYDGNYGGITFGGMYVAGGLRHSAEYTHINWGAGFLRIKNNQQDKILIGGGDEWGQQNISLNPTGGNVGIGTTGPQTKLDVTGSKILVSNGVSEGYTYPASWGKFTTIGDALGDYSRTPGIYGVDVAWSSDWLVMGMVDRAGSNAKNAIINWGDDAGDDLRFVFNQTDVMRITSSGNVGIGTTSPAAQLQVVGDTRFGCRSGFWPVADGRICMQSFLQGAANAWVAIGVCKSVAPGCRICEHNDMQQACGAGYNPYGSAKGWYGDHGVAAGGNWDDEYGVWNNPGCADNNDDPAEHAGNQSYQYRCCY